jgi:spermidine synthase
LSYTGIEIDEEVIYLASKYMLPRLHSEVEMIQADALSFIKLNKVKYDLIMMDVFESDYIPTQFEEIDFLERMDAHLAPDGMIFYNRLANSKEDLHRSMKFFENTFSKVFPTAYYHRVKGNLMLVSKEKK